MAINYFPTTILCSSYSKAFLADGATSGAVMPGMLAEVIGRLIDGTVIYRPTLVENGTATCCVVLENIAMGAMVGERIFSPDERITVAYIPPGEMFNGLADEDQTITVGDHLTCSGGGRFHRFTIAPVYSNVVVAIAMENIVIPAGDYAYIKMVAF